MTIKKIKKDIKEKLHDDNWIKMGKSNGNVTMEFAHISRKQVILSVKIKNKYTFVHRIIQGYNQVNIGQIDNVTKKEGFKWAKKQMLRFGHTEVI